MKIEMLVPALRAAGMEMVVAILTRGLARRGHDVGVTCIIEKGSVGETLEREGHRVTVVPAPGLRTNFAPSGLQEWLLHRKPDVAHIHTGAWLKGARGAWLGRVPRIVLTMHGLDGTRPWYEQYMDRLAARYADVVVPVSDAFVSYVSLTARVEQERVRTIPNGIDTTRFRPGPRTQRVRAAFGLDDTDIVIGHVARFSPVKNHTMLVNAFGQVLEANPKAFLALVGDGKLRPEVEAQVRRLGIAGRVGFLGEVREAAEIYRDFDIFVLPSVTEASSVSLLEAMATGLPAIATAVGGTPALVGNGEAAVLVPPNDGPALASAVIELSRQPVERARLGSAARERVEKMYSQETMIDAYEAVYRGTS